MVPGRSEARAPGIRAPRPVNFTRDRWRCTPPFTDTGNSAKRTRRATPRRAGRKNMPEKHREGDTGIPFQRKMHVPQKRGTQVASSGSSSGSPEDPEAAGRWQGGDEGRWMKTSR
ncbi:unnamed protein product [Lota lota]